MKIHYTFVESNFYKENKKVSEDLVKHELNNNQFRWLLKTGKCNIYSKNIEIIKTEDKPLKQPKPIKIKPKVPDDKLYEMHKFEYRIVKMPYKHTIKLGVERHNKRGYYNFVTYLESEDNYRDAVIQDIKDQLTLQQYKKLARKNEFMIGDED